MGTPAKDRIVDCMIAGFNAGKDQRFKNDQTNKVIAYLLDRCQDQDGTVTGTFNLEELADDYGISTRQLRRRLNELSAFGLLSVSNQPGGIKTIQFDNSAF